MTRICYTLERTTKGKTTMNYNLLIERCREEAESKETDIQEKGQENGE